jgi:hypothetical protein
MKFNFNLKLNFLYFFILNLRKEREWLGFGGRERKTQLIPILAMKTSDFGFNGFILMSKV